MEKVVKLTDYKAQINTIHGNIKLSKTRSVIQELYYPTEAPKYNS